MNRLVGEVNGKEAEAPMDHKILNSLSDNNDLWSNLEIEFAHEVKGEVDYISKNSTLEETCVSAVTDEKLKDYDHSKVKEILKNLDREIIYSMQTKSPPKYFIDHLVQLNNLDFSLKLIVENPQIVEIIFLAYNYEEQIPQQCTSRIMAEAIRREVEVKKLADIAMRKLTQVIHASEDKSFDISYEEDFK